MNHMRKRGPSSEEKSSDSELAPLGMSLTPTSRAEYSGPCAIAGQSSGSCTVRPSDSELAPLGMSLTPTSRAEYSGPCAIESKLRTLHSQVKRQRAGVFGHVAHADQVRNVLGALRKTQGIVRVHHGQYILDASFCA